MEINEAFAPQVIACLREMGASTGSAQATTLNPNGGAIALGHPLGASGARLAITALHELRRRGGGYAIASACIGGGQGNRTLPLGVASTRKLFTAGRLWDVLAALAIGFAVWKIFVAPRSFEPAGTHPAPAAIYERLEGDAFRVADARGRVLFLDFYASGASRASWSCRSWKRGRERIPMRSSCRSTLAKSDRLRLRLRGDTGYTTSRSI